MKLTDKGFGHYSKVLTEKQIKCIKARNGDDLENPVYTGNIEQKERTRISTWDRNLKE